MKRGVGSGALVMAALAALILAGPVSPAAAHDVIESVEPPPVGADDDELLTLSYQPLKNGPSVLVSGSSALTRW